MQTQPYFLIWDAYNRVCFYGKCLFSSEPNKLIATFLSINLPMTFYYAIIAPV